MESGQPNREKRKGEGGRESDRPTIKPGETLDPQSFCKALEDNGFREIMQYFDAKATGLRAREVELDRSKEEQTGQTQNPEKIAAIKEAEAQLKKEMKAFEQERRAMMLGMMAMSQASLMQNINVPISGTPQVTLVGQQHNFQADVLIARHAAHDSARKHGALILEGDGNVHPLKDPTGLITIGKEKNACSITVTEHELYSLFEGRPNPNQGGLKERPRPGLTIDERSWLVGMYLANLIVRNPDLPITVIFGEKHLKEIEDAMKTFLQYMGYNAQPNVKIIPSLSEKSQLPSPLNSFDTSELTSGKEKVTHSLEAFKKEQPPQVEIDPAIKLEIETVKAISQARRNLKIGQTDYIFDKGFNSWARAFLGMDRSFEALSERTNMLQQAISMLPSQKIDWNFIQAMDAVIEKHGPRVLFERLAIMLEIQRELNLKSSNPTSLLGTVNSFLDSGKEGLLRERVNITKEIMKIFELPKGDEFLFRSINSFLDAGGHVDIIFDIAKQATKKESNPFNRQEVFEDLLSAASLHVTPVDTHELPSSVNNNNASQSPKSESQSSEMSVNPVTSFEELLKGLDKNDRREVMSIMQTAHTSTRVSEDVFKEAMINDRSAGAAVGVKDKILELVDSVAAQLQQRQQFRQ